jgi:hypothetical protein
MPWRVSEEQIIEAKLRSGGLTVGYYRSDGNVSAVKQIYDTGPTLIFRAGTPSPPRPPRSRQSSGTAC